jgi:hypothetical protein
MQTKEDRDKTKGVKQEKIKWSKINTFLFFGFVLFFLNWWLLYLPLPLVANTVHRKRIFRIAVIP